MINKILSVKFIFLIILVSIISYSVFNVLDVPKKIYRSYYSAMEEILEQELYISDSNSILERSIEIMSNYYPELSNIVINQTPSNNNVALVVVDVNNLYSTKNTYNFIKKANNNFVTVGKKYIIIDQNFLNIILLNSAADFGTEKQIDYQNFVIDNKLLQNNPLFSDESNRESSHRRSFNQSRMLRAENTNLQLNRTGDTGAMVALDYYNYIKDIDTLREYIDEVASSNPEDYYVLGSLIFYYLSEYKYNNSFSSNNSVILGLYEFLSHDYDSNDKQSKKFPFGDSIAVPFASALAPFLLHEWKHIQQNYNGAFVNNIEDKFNKELVKKISSNELDADKYAIERITQSQSHNHKFKIANYNYDFSSGIYSMGKMLEDMSFYEHFLRFRQMNLQSIGSMIIYNKNNCNESKHGFFDMLLIKDIKEVLMPLLTIEELRTIEIQEKQRNNAYPHLYDRSKMFQSYANNDVMKKYEKQSTYSSVARKALTSGIHNLNLNNLKEAYQLDIERLFPNQFKEGLLFDNNVLEKLSGLGLTKETIASCPFEKCTLLTNKKDIFIEFGFNNNRLVYITLYIRVFASRLKNWDEGWQPPSEESKTRYNQYLSILQTIVSQINNKKFTESNINNIENPELRDFLNNLNNCGFASLETNNSNGRMSISTYDNDKSIFLNFISK